MKNDDKLSSFSLSNNICGSHYAGCVDGDVKDDVTMRANVSHTDLLPHYTVTSPDDRLITPMVDTMIYDRINSSLDFEDGRYFACVYSIMFCAFSQVHI